MKRAAAVVPVLLAAALLAALSCAPARRKPAAQEIVFWQSWPAGIVEPLVAEFERAHPGLEVRVEPLPREDGRERILAAIAADSVPDLCQIGSDWMPGLLAGGRLSDWSAGVADLMPHVRGWELCSVGEALYGLPWVLRTRALFYDKTLFARAHLDSTRPPGTWDELYHAAAAIQRLGRGVHGCGVQAGDRRALAQTVLPLLWGNGGRVLSDDLRKAVFDSAQNVEALEFFLSLRRVGLLASQDTLDREFERGRLGLLLSGAWLLERLPREAPGLHYGVAPVPAPGPDRGTHASWADGEVLVSFGASRHKQHALELARFLAQPENVLALAAAAGSVLPAAAEADTSAYYLTRPLERALVRQLGNSRFTPSHPAWIEMEEAIADEVAQALHDTKSAAQAVHDAQARLAGLVGRR